MGGAQVIGNLLRVVELSDGGKEMRLARQKNITSRVSDLSLSLIRSIVPVNWSGSVKMSVSSAKK